MMSHLPTAPRLLTSLLTTLFSISPVSASSTTTETPTNPLHALSSSNRALLTTLHVLIPPPTLLQALDLLDRGLVTRITLKDELPQSSPKNRDGDVTNLQAPLHPPASGTESLDTEKNARIYLVRSSQQVYHSGSRFSTGVGAGTAGTNYVVRLEAWNCSCAAFAFAALPGGEGPQISYDDREGDAVVDFDVEGSGGDEDVDEREWEFGGLSRNPRQVPCCKHLLACLMGERWGMMLTGYVEVREVGREEMAGIEGEV